MAECEKRIDTASGIPVYTYLNPASSGFFISLFVKSGCMYETAEESGITHFFEHIAIRNVNCLMDGELYRLLDRYGIEFNASTFSEMVQFYLSGASENFPRAIPVLKELFSPIALSSSEIDSERRRIKAEIREADENNSLFSFAQEKVFEGTSLARPITGTLGSVSRIGKGRLEDFRRRVFTPDNLFVYVTGNVDKESLAQLVRMLGGVTLFDGVSADNLAPVPSGFLKRAGGVYIKSAQYTGLRLNFDVDMRHASVAELDLIYDAVLSGYSSPMFIELSEKRGLCYDLSGNVERYKNLGVFSFGFETKESKLSEALSVALGIISRMKTEEFWRELPVGASYVDNCMMLYDDNRDLCFTFAYDNHLLGAGYRDLASRREEYVRARTPSALAAACRRIFTRDGLTLAIRGNKRRIDLEELKMQIDNNF